MRKLCCVIFSILFASFSMYAQNIGTLKSEVVKIITDKKATIGVSIIGTTAKDTFSINGERHFPLISVFKFHIALTTLSKVDKGELSLKQKVFIKKVNY